MTVDKNVTSGSASAQAVTITKDDTSTIAYVVSDGTHTAALTDTDLTFAENSGIVTDSNDDVSGYVNVAKVLAEAVNENTIDVSTITGMTLRLEKTEEETIPVLITNALIAEGRSQTFAYEVHPVATVTTTTTTGDDTQTTSVEYDASDCLASGATFTFKLSGLEAGEKYTLYHYGDDGTQKSTPVRKVADQNGEIEMTLYNFSYVVGELNENYDCAGYLQETYANIRSSLLWNVYFHIDTSVIADPASTAKIVVSSAYDDEIDGQEYSLTYDSSRSAYYITVPIRPRLIDQPVGFTLVSDGTTYSLKLGASGTTEYVAVPYAFNTYLSRISDNTFEASIAALRSYRDTLLAIWPVS